MGVQKLNESAERAALMSVLERLHLAQRGLVKSIQSEATDWWAWSEDSRLSGKPALKHLVDGIRTLTYKPDQARVNSFTAGRV